MEEAFRQLKIGSDEQEISQEGTLVKVTQARMPAAR
jgi:hypothetical protein